MLSFYLKLSSHGFCELTILPPSLWFQKRLKSLLKGMSVMEGKEVRQHSYFVYNMHFLQFLKTNPTPSFRVLFHQVQLAPLWDFNQRRSRRLLLSMQNGFVQCIHMYVKEIVEHQGKPTCNCCKGEPTKGQDQDGIISFRKPRAGNLIIRAVKYESDKLCPCKMIKKMSWLNSGLLCLTLVCYSLQNELGTLLGQAQMINKHI